MTTATDKAKLLTEIQAAAEEQLTTGREVSATWLTHAVVSAHKDIRGQDADWYRSRGYEAVRAAVREVVRRYREDLLEAEENRQQVLPGYDRLQSRYLIDRDGEQRIVPLEKLTEKEARFKVEELRRMSVGCALHADELERWADATFSEAAE